MRIKGNGNVGIGTTAPNSKLHVNGPIATAIKTVTAADYTITDNDSIIIVNNSTYSSIYLPNALGRAGMEYTIKKISTVAFSHNVIVFKTGANTIDGGDSYLLENQYAYVRVVSDGVRNWYVIGNGR
jgi:hypothetical protein